MNAKTPFWPLLKSEMSYSMFGGKAQTCFMLLCAWFVAGAMPLVLLRFELQILFQSGILAIVIFMFVLWMTTFVSMALVPGCADLLPPGPDSGQVNHGLGGLGFIFTRAADRRIFFRARSAAVFLFALTPLFLNVAASPLAREVHTGALSDSRYSQAFPDMNHGIIPYGAIAYTGWLAWSATALFLFLQAYGALIANRVKPNNKWTGIFPAMPLIVLFVSFIAWNKIIARAHVSFGEDSFLFFAMHPGEMVIALMALAVVVQIWSERRFSKLEIL